MTFGGGLLLLFVLLFISLAHGQANVSVHAVLEALFARADKLEHHIVWEMRLPRAVMAMLAGSALAVAGVLLQTITRNPLASAGTFGINAGAYFIVVLAAVFLPALKSEMPLLLAFVGGACAAGMAYVLAGGKRSTPVRMALAGMIVTLVLSSFTSAMQLLFENETNGLFLWGSGSLIQDNWKGVQHGWVWIIAGLVIAVLMTRALDMLELSEETAQALGQRVDRMRIVALLVAVLLAAATVSVVGPIGFVGLIAPHLIRLMGFHRHRLLIPGSALWGANVLLLADIVSQMFRSTIGELPAGVVTAILGAPWLIWLALRSSREEAAAVGGSSSMSIGMLHNRLPYPVLLFLAVSVLALCSIGSLLWGSTRIPFTEWMAVLTGQGENVLLQLRMPRVAVAILAGAALAVAGATIQGAVRNPLADPSIIGVTSGAGVGALLWITVIPSASAAFIPLASMAGAVLSAVVVYALAWRKGLHPTILILIGIAVTAVNSAIIHFLVIQSGMSAAPALAWLAGSTYAREWGEVNMLLAFLVILLPAAWLLGKKVDLLAFGDQTSMGLGLKLQRTRIYAAGIGVMLAAAAVSAVGTIGFIGLLAPHAARMAVGHNHRRLVLLSAVLGAIMLVIADVIGRVALAPKQIPAGLIVALIGTPYLLMLMFRSRMRRF
ncbi:iron ABC transporter permease [Xylanibacillus composti]|nr:iron ABC transporter permease [Xylanibacillus composti]